MKIWGVFLRFMGIALSAALLAGAVLLMFATIPQLGNKALIVRSGSMAPAINAGDLVVVRPRDTGYEEGEVIAYQSPANEEVTVTHRVAERSPTTEGFEYITQGDANEERDAYRVQENQVLGRQLMVIPHVGRMLALGKTRIGFISFVIAPATLIIVGDALAIWRGVRKRRHVTRLKRGSVKEEGSGLRRESRVELVKKRKIGAVPNRRMKKRVRVDGMGR